MKKLVAYFTVIILLSLTVSGFLWIILAYDSQGEQSISPLPDFLTLSKNNQVRFLDLWFPQFTNSDTTAVLGTNDITAKSALVYDITTDKTIFEKESNVRLPMASLTKIMTAIIALENKKENDRYIVSNSDLVGEDSMGLSVGEVLSQEELLYGLMLPSGNDAAEVLASNFPTGRDEFIRAMNSKANSLGLVNTNFDNPSGLQGDGVQYTTAFDLVVITRYALENFSLFAKVVSTPSYSISETQTNKAYDLQNETNLLTTYEGVKGVKTGFTPEAGLCLVTYIDYKGHRLIGVILNSENRRGEMKSLLDYSLKSLGISPPEYKG